MAACRAEVGHAVAAAAVAVAVVAAVADTRGMAVAAVVAAPGALTVEVVAVGVVVVAVALAAVVPMAVEVVEAAVVAVPAEAGEVLLVAFRSQLGSCVRRVSYSYFAAILARWLIGSGGFLRVAPPRLVRHSCRRLLPASVAGLHCRVRRQVQVRYHAFPALLDARWRGGILHRWSLADRRHAGYVGQCQRHTPREVLLLAWLTARSPRPSTADPGDGKPFR